MKKNYILVAFAVFSIVSLYGCTKKEVADNVYSETLGEKEQLDYTKVVQELVAVANYKYTDVNGWTDDAANSFSLRLAEEDRAKFLEDFNSYREARQKKIDTHKLDVTAQVVEAKKLYDELIDFGQKHALLYSDNSKTQGTGVVYEIEPLDIDDGAMLWDRQTEQLLANAQEQAQGSMLPEIVVDREFLPTFELEDVISYETPDTLRESVDGSTSKDNLVDIFNEKFKTIYLTGDWGDYEPTEEELRMSSLYSAGTGINSEGIIDGYINRDIWSNYTLEEAKEYVYNALNFHITQYNQSKTDEYNQFFTEEYQNEMRDIEKRQKEYARRLDMESRGEELPQATEVKTAEEMYELWRVSSKDAIEAIEENDMKNPETSSIIRTNGDRFYVEWLDVLKLAQDTNITDEKVFLKAYNEEFIVNIAEAPSDLITSISTARSINISDWSVSVTSAGVKDFRVSLVLPEGTKSDIVFTLSDDSGLLNYEQSIGSLLFN